MERLFLRSHRAPWPSDLPALGEQTLARRGERMAGLAVRWRATHQQHVPAVAWGSVSAQEGPRALGAAFCKHSEMLHLTTCFEARLLWCLQEPRLQPLTWDGNPVSHWPPTAVMGADRLRVGLAPLLPFSSGRRSPPRESCLQSFLLIQIKNNCYNPLALLIQ